MKKNKEITEKTIMMNGELDTQKISELLLSEMTDIRRQVCQVLEEGLRSLKPVVCDGTLFSEIDYPTRLKYAEAIAEIIGDKKQEQEDQKGNNYHIIFTLIKQIQRDFPTSSSPSLVLDTGDGVDERRA